MFKEIEASAKKAGEIVRFAHNVEAGVRTKTSKVDLVTEYDVRVQEYLYRELSKLCPDAHFIGEEEKSGVPLSERLAGKAFIIDPIDGTTNFVRDLRQSAVSIGYAENGEVVYGCCYLPYTDELYTARKGQGAFCNGQPIHCRDRSISEAIVFCGTSPYDKETLGVPTFAVMQTLFRAGMDVRRFGSSVIEMLSVASGKTDLYCEMRLSPWDHAAAAMIAREAGAVASNMKGEPLRYDKKCSCIVASPACYAYFMSDPDIMRYKDFF